MLAQFWCRGQLRPPGLSLKTAWAFIKKFVQVIDYKTVNHRLRPAVRSQRFFLEAFLVFLGLWFPALVCAS